MMEEENVLYMVEMEQTIDENDLDLKHLDLDFQIKLVLAENLERSEEILKESFAKLLSAKVFKEEKIDGVFKKTARYDYCMKNKKLAETPVIL